VILQPGFTYHGQLKKNGVPVNVVCVMDFSLWDYPTNGNQIGFAYNLGVTVTNGLFTVLLNSGNQFGPNPFNGQERWLDDTV
jgi:hypothetical protein